MPISIAGSGTITGISAGGLPDDSVTTAEIAAGAVTPAKLSTGAPSWDTSSRVGIGTSSPSSLNSNANQLVVGSGTGSQGLTVFAGSASDANIFFADGTTGSQQTIGYIQYRHASDRFDFGTNDTTRMSIDSSGRVGIGSTPVVPLDVRGADHVVIAATPSSGNGEGSIYLGCIGTGIKGNIIGRDIISFQTTSSSTPVTSGTERARITSDGRFGVNATNFANGRLITESDGTAITPFVVRDTAAGTSSVNSVGFFRNATQVGSIALTGSATAYNTSSDYRLKENIEPIQGATNRILQLKPSRFNFIVDPDHTVDGFIAHEAQAVVPECVTGTKDAVDADGNPVYQGIDQSKLVPLLTAALQEAIGRIETLEAEVALLKGGS
jgi:hypothetical protein